MRYYFLITSFPDLKIGTDPGITFDELKGLLAMNLSESDQEKMRRFLLLIDLKNIRARWLGEPIDPRGNLSEKELEEALLIKENLPEYVFDFLDTYESPKDRLRFFTFIYAKFFQEALNEEGFLRKYFVFERELRLVLLALRAKQTGRDVQQELQFEDPTDAFVAYILAQKDADDFTPPIEYERVKQIYQENIENPKGLAQKFLEYRFQKIEEMEESDVFGIDQVFGFMAKLLLVDYWFHLDDDEGAALLSSIA